MTSRSFVKALLLCAALFLRPAFGMTPDNPVGSEVSEGWGPWVTRTASKPFVVVNNYIEWLNLFATVMQVPDVVMVDSTDPKRIKLCASLAAGAACFKIVSMTPKKEWPLKILLWDIPKMLCYLASTGYDTIRILDAPKVALKNHNDSKKLRFFKLTQGGQLLIEAAIRIVAIMAVLNNQDPSGEKPAMAILASEVADIVSIWRLLERYKTYFISEYDMLEFSFAVKKSQAQGTLDVDDQQEIEKLEELAALAEAFAEKQSLAQSTSDQAESVTVDEAA